MRTINADTLDVKEMSNKQLEEVNGGWFWALIGGAILCEILFDPEGSGEAIMDGYSKRKGEIADR